MSEVVQRYKVMLTFTEPLLGHKKDYKDAEFSYFYRDDDDPR